LVEGFRGIICDLDGVVYRGRAAIPGAIETLSTLINGGIGVVFATNNASRTPGEVCGHLRELGLRIEPSAVVTSAQAAAAHVATKFAGGTGVLAVGGPGVASALREVGMRPLVPGSGEEVSVVVQGAGAGVSWTDLAEASFAIQAGAHWVVTNRDLTIPMQRGLAPGNGTLVAAVHAATLVEPYVVGKPEPFLYRLAAERLGLEPEEIVAVGDRLDTDIAGARAAGLPSLLVLSGAHGTGDLAATPRSHQPTFVAADLAGLLAPPSLPRFVSSHTW